MRRFFLSWLGVCSVMLAVLGIMSASPVQAQSGNVCFCRVTIDAKKIADNEPISVIDDRERFDRVCDPLITEASCVPGGDPKIDKKYDSCRPVASMEQCSALVSEYDRDRENAKQILIARRNGGISGAGASVGPGSIKQPGLLARVLPECVFDSTVHGECKDVNVFIKLAIDMADILLSIIGGVALIAFLYGGFVLILSEGNSEKIEKGKGVLVAALIGLVVVFSAYLLVNVLSDALGVSSNFRLQ